MPSIPTSVAMESELLPPRGTDRRVTIMVRVDDDPRAPYKVYEGDELKGTYATRAEARRAQQRLESQSACPTPQRNFIIRDRDESLCDGRVVQRASKAARTRGVSAVRLAPTSSQVVTQIQ